MDIILDTTFTVPGLKKASTVLAADTFDYTSPTLLPTKVGERVWAEVPAGGSLLSTLAVAGSAVIAANPTTYADSRFATVPAVSNVVVESTLSGKPETPTSRWPFIAARISPDGSKAIIVWALDFWEIQAWQSGAGTPMVATSFAPTVGDKVALTVGGDVASLHINGIPAATVAAPAATYPGTLAGIASRRQTSRVSRIGQAWGDFRVRTPGII
ncbi:MULTISPECIES: hypothetical protein [unclassified Microbacterium]|uniref:hypothetical protein n=1 Tax=unclassified Microbacterium TaxID=2609290 RepID=UPI0030167AB4